MVSHIANKMTAVLVDGGYLMTGHGELYAHPLGRLRTRVFPHSIVYQKTTLLPHQPPAPRTIEPALLPAAIPSKPQVIAPVIPPSIVKPLTPSVTMQAAWDYANQGQPEQARFYCEQLSTQNPLDPHPYYLSALLAQEQGKLEEVKALLKKVLYLAPDFITAYLELGDIYAKESNLALARKMWTSAYHLLQQLPQAMPVEMFGTSTAADILKFVEHRLNG
jgi:chemotaxis protein methyltransferase CheR